MRQALLISIWQLSAIFLTSSPLKLCQVGCGQTLIFRFLQKYYIGFKLRLCLGHSRTFTELWIRHSCCVFRSIGRQTFCPSEVLNALDLGFHQGYLYILVHWAFLLLWRVLQSLPHSMRLLPADFTFGMVLCRWWAELHSIQQDAWNWASSDQIILFLTVWGSLWWFFENSKCVFMCLHRGEDWVLPHCHKSPGRWSVAVMFVHLYISLSVYTIMELN